MFGVKDKREGYKYIFNRGKTIKIISPYLVLKGEESRGNNQSLLIENGLNMFMVSIFCHSLTNSPYISINVFKIFTFFLR